MPSRAASVSTFVVSWKEAAERKDSVASEALVIPRITSSARAGVFVFLPLTFSLIASKLMAVLELAGQQLGRALRLDPHLLQHLARRSARCACR